MARTLGSTGAKTREAIHKAGLDLIYRHGFEAVSLRRLAAEVGIREGSLYNHFTSKQELLFRLVDDHMERLLATLDEAMRETLPPEPKLMAFIAFHLRYHMTRQAEVFVINSELRSLEPEHRAAIVAKRDRYESALTGILQDGFDRGVFRRTDPGVATKALIAMLTGVCTWFRAEGRLSIEDVIGIHTDLVLRGLRTTS